MTTATASELQALPVAKVVDARGAACPGPLLEAKKVMGSVPVGSVIELWSTDTGTRTDVAAWSSKVGHDFLGFVEDAGYDRVYVRRQK
jgi:TusA-related sulfurtransferase